MVWRYCVLYASENEARASPLAFAEPYKEPSFGAAFFGSVTGFTARSFIDHALNMISLFRIERDLELALGGKTAKTGAQRLGVC